MLRTLGGKNIGKCRLRAHQHPLSPPLPNLRQAHPHVKHPRQDASSTRDERVLGWVLGDVLEMCCFLHRFLISGPDLRIDARFCLFKPSFVHRFLISSPDLGIDVSFSPFTPSFMHRFLISSPDLRIDARISPFKSSCVHRFLISSPDLLIDARGEWFRLQQLLRQRCSASDSNLRSCKEEWPACRGCRDNEVRVRF